MMGILIALQIGEWNELRKLERERLDLIEDLKTDMVENLALLETVIAKGEESVESITRFLEYAVSKDDTIEVDEIKSSLLSGAGAFRFDLSMPAYEEALSSGSLGLIESRELKKLFIELEQNDIHLQRLISNTTEFVFLGPTLELHKEVGSRYVLRDDVRNRSPDVFALSDSEYREYISQKKVYAMYEALGRLQSSKLGQVRQIENKVIQILETLDTLD